MKNVFTKGSETIAVVLLLFVIAGTKASGETIDAYKKAGVHLVSDISTELQKLRSSTDKSETSFPLNLVDRFPELTTINKIVVKIKTTTPKDFTQLENNTTAFFQPRPDPVVEAIKPDAVGNPKVQNPSLIQTNNGLVVADVVFSQIHFTVPPSVTVPFNGVVLQSVHEISPSSEPQNFEKHTSNDKMKNSEAKNYVDPLIVLSYNPTRPFYVPNPVTIGQIIPPGTPWPASAKDKTKTSFLSTVSPTSSVNLPTETKKETKRPSPTTPSSNKIQEQKFPLESVASNKDDVEPSIVLNYKPTRPPYLPNPVTIGQIIPPGTPWPASAQKQPAIIQSEQEGTTSFGIGLPEVDLYNIPSEPTYSRPEFGNAVTKETITTTPLVTITNDKLPFEDKFKITTSADIIKPSIILTYKPTRPPYVPKPVTIPQIIPPGTPWPASASMNKTTANSIGPPEADLDNEPSEPTFNPPFVNSATNDTKTTTIVNEELPIEDNFKTTSSDIAKPSIILTYKPTRPSYVPQPVTIPQIIPPGTPWPASASKNKTTANSIEHHDTNLDNAPSEPTFNPEFANAATNDTKTTAIVKEELPIEDKFKTTSIVKPSIILTYKPTRPSYVPNPVTIGQIIPPGNPLPASPNKKETKSPPLSVLPPSTAVDQLANNSLVDTSPDLVKPSIVLDYKPTRPSYVPNPVTIPQIIPPGTPWPASANEEEMPSTPPTTVDQKLPVDNIPSIVTSSDSESFIVLTYKPTRPSYVPNPITIPQIIPPGTPWPASAPEQKKQPSEFSADPDISPVTDLIYKPFMPFFVPNPATPAQIIPAGTPWPASVQKPGSGTGKAQSLEKESVEETTSSSNVLPDIKEKVGTTPTNTETPSASNIFDHPLPSLINENVSTPLEEEYSTYRSLQQPRVIKTLRENNNLLEPNALQYYGGRVTHHRVVTAAAPFTSGTQRTTLSDIVDILKEVHNISLPNAGSEASPSDLLPFDIDKTLSDTNQRTGTSGQSAGSRVKSSVRVYDGRNASNRDRIFPNPKFNPK